MNRDDVEKLLGGYAAGTLTESERQALFAAALEDQQLFESLAAEEPLRELLQDPAAKAQLLAALDDRPAPWYRRLMRPAFGIAAGAAMVLLAVFVRHEPPKPEPVIVAETRHEPVRSFQPPLPVEKSPLPTVLRNKPAALPPPPVLSASPPPAAPVDAIAQATPAAPAAPAAQNATEPLSVAELDKESAKVAVPIVPAQPLRPTDFVAGAKGAAPAPPSSPPPARFLALFRGRGDAQEAVRLGLRFTVLKKSPAGELTELDPQKEMDRNDEVVIRFVSSEAGFLSVSQLNVPNGLHEIANQLLTPSVPYTIPKTGSFRANGTATNEFLVTFSRVALKTEKRAESASSQPGGRASIVSTGADIGPQLANFTITLKYK
jgi:hypothetical protein